MFSKVVCYRGVSTFEIIVEKGKNYKNKQFLHFPHVSMFISNPYNYVFFYQESIAQSVTTWAIVPGLVGLNPNLSHSFFKI